MTPTAKRRNSKPHTTRELKAPPVGERILSVAAELFASRGVQAVGVEEIVRRADIAKISLYRSFASKDDLVVTWLKKRAEDFWRQWNELVDEHPDDPRKQIGAIFEHLARRTTQPGYLGCPFLKLCCEFPSGAHPGRLPAEQAKREMRRRLHAIVAQLNVKDAKQLADALLLLIEGAYGISQSLGGKEAPGRSIVWAAEALIDAQAV
jgi:AcrR family transcriptional regulator